MRSWSLVLAVVAGLGMRDAVATPSPASPPELIATMAIGVKLDPLRAYLDTVRPGMSMTLSDALIRSQLASEVHAASLEGLDPAAGTYILVVTSGDTFAFALAGKVRDAAQLAKDASKTDLETQNGWAVLGDATVAKLVAPYAFATLPSHPVPTMFAIELEVPRLVAKFQPLIAGAHERAKQMFGNETQNTSHVISSVIDGAFGMVDEIDRATLTIDATKDVASVDFAFTPKPRSRFAQFVAAQHPGDFSLLGRLPALAAMMIVAGRFDAGPYREAMIEVMGTLYSAGTTDKAVASAFDAIMKAATGEVAMVATAFPQASAQVFAVDDPKRVDQAVDTLAKALATGRSFEVRGVTTTIQTKTKAERHGDARLAEFSFDYDTSRAAKPMRDAMAKTVAKTNVEQVGTVGKLGLVAMNVELDRAIDALRGTGKVLAIDAGYAAQLTEARARKDSLAGVMDISSMLGLATPVPMYLGLGYADARMHFRMGVPATTAFTLAKR